MMAANRFVVAAFMMSLLPLAGGCGSRFAGEWVQESTTLPNGTPAPVTGERRLAFQFIPPSSVRVGMYVDASKVVEPGTVMSSDYQTIQNRSVAEFGAYTARVENGELIAYIGGEEKGRFRKLKGQSVFPPIVPLPQFVSDASSIGGPSAADIAGAMANAPADAPPGSNAPAVAVADDE